MVLILSYMTTKELFIVMGKRTRQTNLHFPPVIAIRDMCNVSGTHCAIKVSF